jgi:regulator of protease activity HflC (stomatin/prohibitin superfamily)
MKINRLNKFLCALSLLGALGCDKVPAGHVGIKVYMLGGNKGVDHEVLTLGRYWIGMNEELYLFPTYQQTDTWVNPCPPGSQEIARNGDDCKVTNESISFQTKEGMVVNADVGISYSLDPAKIPDVFQKYRRGINEISDTFLRNHVRDSMNSIGSNSEIESVYGSGKDKFMTDVQALVVKQVESIGIKIDKIYLLGSLRLPPSVIQALNEKMAATQKAQQRQNEVAEAEAQARKQVATAEGEARSSEVNANGEAKKIRAIAEAKAAASRMLADAEAQNNLTVAKSLTTELLQYERVKRWNGVLPTTVLGDKDVLVNLK